MQFVVLLLWTLLPGVAAGVIAEAQRHPVEHQEGGFLLAAALFASALTLAVRPWRRAFVHGALAGGAWVAIYAVYADYMDHPWLAGPETNSCDGPCYGWYTFENEPLYWPFAVVAVMGILAASLVSWLSKVTIPVLRGERR